MFLISGEAGKCRNLYHLFARLKFKLAIYSDALARVQSGRKEAVTVNALLDLVDFESQRLGAAQPAAEPHGLQISRVFRLFSEKRTLDVRGEYCDAFNHPRFADPAGAFGTASFGYIESTSVAPHIVR